ncbi:hypothetical protein MPTK1_2g10120 [Marchantia polymorpha subsp. ruderalis]|uniref:Uncharacterized protein n=1 Tax=Marchantia polymorpha TaxID=3197 RepID=A0A2R6W8K4_MARPO|nr:hypothetical protein MARPO_0129s0036 [Marchantia polymorpha]BBN01766.1 hypothetical protein Mp_2g10120 [Marchantia polymorpha subsp. ruderalis]|eukprot:PTQ30149.1 hypothetical protein MARPO_0129s0036 [Marchantia polymorpha]
MVLESSLASLRLDASPVEGRPPARKKESEKSGAPGAGANLADLCDEDKAKVARLINQVLLAFREIHRLRDLLEDRNSHESITSKLREQNQEMAAEISQLRLKLAWMQNLLSPLQGHKVSLQADKTASSLTPIREAECPEADTHVPSQIMDVADVKQELSDQLAASPAEMETTLAKADRKDERLYDEFRTTDVPVSAEARGKENKDPEASSKGLEAESCHLTEQEAVIQRRRPLPRPLPDLVVNILNKNNEATSLRSRDFRERTDPDVTPDRPPGKKQESSSSDPELVRPLASDLHNSDLLHTDVRPNELIHCPEVACQKYSGESDESLRSSNSRKKMRFDPTAGEEGEFYYASEIENEVFFLRAKDDDTAGVRIQIEKTSTDYVCTRCSKPRSKKKLERHGHTQMNRRKSTHELATTEDKIGCDQLKPHAGSIGQRICLADEDHGLISGSHSYGSATHRTSSNSHPRNLHRCVKCSSPLLSDISGYGDGTKSSVEAERRRRCQYDVDSHASSTSRHSSCSHSRIIGKCARCCYPANGNSANRSIREGKSSKRETDYLSADEVVEFHNVRWPSGKKKISRSGKPTNYLKETRSLGHVGVKYGGEFVTGSLAYEQASESRIKTCVSSVEDCPLSPQSSADSMMDVSRRSSPLIQPKAGSSIKGRVVNRKGELDANEVEDVQDSECEMFLVNHEKLESSLRSDSEYSESLECSSLVDAKIFETKSGHGGISEKTLCRASAEGRLELGSNVASNDPPQQARKKNVEEIPVVDVNTVGCDFYRHDKRTGEKEQGVSDDVCTQPGNKNVEGTPAIDVNTAGRKAPRHGKWSGEKGKVAIDDVYAQPGGMQTEKVIANVEDLLGRFIRSNAECAAELIRCSKYIQSTASEILSKQPKSNKKKFNLNKLPDDKAEETEEQTPESTQACHIHLPIGRRPLDQFARCAGCLVIMKPEVITSVKGKSVAEEKVAEALCGKCSTSRALLRSPKYLSSASAGADNDQNTRLPTSTKIQVQVEARPVVSSLDYNTTNSLPRKEDHPAPTEGDVAYPPQEAKEREGEKTEDLSTGSFDISLFHLINDLEVEDIEYWNHINTQAIDEDTGIRMYDSRRKRILRDKGQASATGHWRHPKRNANFKHFR